MRPKILYLMARVAGHFNEKRYLAWFTDFKMVNMPTDIHQGIFKNQT
jgi:hypothetical protein